MGDEEIERCADALFSFACKRVGSTEEAADLVQETLIAHLSAPEKFRGDAALLTYLTGILKFKILDFYRKQAKESMPGDIELHQIMERANRINTNDRSNFEVFDALHNSLHRLKSPYREAFILREVDGHETKEICKILSLSETNLNVVLFRARAQLRQSLREQGVDHTY